MNIRFQKTLRRLFLLFYRLSLIEKILYSFLFIILFKPVAKAVLNWINKLFNNITDYISFHSQTIIVSIAILFGAFLFGAGCFLYLTRLRSKHNQLDEDLDNKHEYLENKFLLEGNTESQAQTIYTEGNHNENIYGDYVEIHGNQININNDFTEVAAQIRELITELKNQGYSQEEAEEEIAKELEEKSANKPKVKRTLRRWKQSFGTKNNAKSYKDIANILLLKILLTW